MERKTKEDVIFYLDRVNEILKKQGKDYYYHFSSRYGYKAINKCYYENSGASDFRTGLTTKEAYNIIYSIYEALTDLQRTDNTITLLKNYSLQKLYNICGYREFNILLNSDHDLITIDEGYPVKVYKISDYEGNYFLYDIDNNRIIG